jgi:long-chain acyl-CoA synthetase
MEKLWLKNYPAGVPAEIDASQFRSLAQLLEESFRTYADRRAFICMDHAITYGELDQLSPLPHGCSRAACAPARALRS